jgi:hypothetical protein
MKDYTLGETIDYKFLTCEPDTGAPITLAGSPVISAYVDNSTTQITAGITLTVDFDGVTGLHNVRVVATSGNGYAAGTNVALVITTGTVDGVSAVGYKVAEFSLGRPGTANVTQWLGTAAATPTVAGVPEVDVTHWIGTAAATPTTAGVPEVDITFIAGAAVSTTTAQLGVNVVQVSADATAADNIEAAFDDTAGAVRWLGIVDQGTAQAATGTTLQLRSAAAFADDELIGATVVITGGSTGVGQSRLITDYVSATDTATVEAWTTTPTGTITYKIYGTAPSSGGSGLDAAGVRAAIGMSSANLDTQLSGLDTKLDTIDNFLDTEMAATLAAVDTEIATLQTSVNTIDDFLDTEIAAIVTAVGTTIPAALTTIDDFLDTEIAAIKAKTDSLTFTQAGHVDANIQRINDVAITGDGQAGTEFNV